MNPISPEPRTRLPLLPILVVVIALAAGLAWWMRRPATVGNVRVTPTPTQAPSGQRPATMSYTLYLPNDQALLSKYVFSEKNPFPKTPTWEMRAGRTLELLSKRLNALPRTTKVLAPPKRFENNVVVVNMSREFMKLDSMHETRVGLVLDAIAKTLEAVEPSDGERVKVRILVEGKPIQTLSEFDLSDVWTSSQPADEMPPDAESVQ